MCIINVSHIYGTSVFHIGTAVKAGGRIRNSEKTRYYWEDKAGGYGIQEPFGMRFVKRIDGDYYNVVGFPVSRIYQELKEKFNIQI